MKEMKLREIQNVELNILKKIDEICEENHFKYYIYYGTLLGAVRHKDFIPWDDDADIIMPRPDFEKFVSYCNKHKKELAPFSLMYYTNNNKYIYPIGRLIDTRYRVDYEGNDDYGLGLFVDIYPYDGVGNTYAEAKKNVKRLRLIRYFLQLAGTNRVYKSQYGLFATLLKYLARPWAKLIGVKGFIKIEQFVIKKYTYNNSKFVANALWNCYGIREIAEKNTFEYETKLEFSGLKFNAPSNFDEHLKRIYGDYMTPPPKEERHPTHDYKAYLKDSIL